MLSGRSNSFPPKWLTRSSRERDASRSVSRRRATRKPAASRRQNRRTGKPTYRKVWKQKEPRPEGRHLRWIAMLRRPDASEGEGQLNITSTMVKELRVKTGAGMMDCKEALTASDGDFEKAIDVLRKKGMSAATKRSSKAAKDGTIASYIHMGGKIGVLVEVNCETDFVAKTEDFQALARDLAMQVAASNPLYVNTDEICEKVIEGKLKKYFEEVCLMDQKFIKNTDITVGTLVSNMIAKTGENIIVRRFSRFQLGEERK